MAAHTEILDNPSGVMRRITMKQILAALCLSVLLAAGFGAAAAILLSTSQMTEAATVP
jgi:hypothetical protein